MMGSVWVRLGATLAGLGVAAGAFGAHALRQAEGITPRAIEVFETGVRYQMFHALGLLLLGIPAIGPRARAVAGSAFLAGIVLFSGSLYGLTLGAPRWFGAITPFGGVGFLLGWAAVASGVRRPAAIEGGSA